MIVSDLFKPHVAKSHAFKRYDIGNAAFVTNGVANNGVQGFVKPLHGDSVFEFEGICLSAFCEATVQSPPFICRGNGGSGLIVLEPKAEIDTRRLLFYASYFNRYTRWRFSYGRMVTKERAAQLKIPESNIKISGISTANFLPEKNKPSNDLLNFKYGFVPLISLFGLKSGDYHNAGNLPDGEIPLVSCAEKNNGVMKFVSVPKNKMYENVLTIAYNGQPLTTKYHPYKFATKDDVAVCIPKQRFKTTTLIFIQFIINMEQWRFSFGRKCYKEKLSCMYLNVPITETGKIDENAIEKLVSNTSYWRFLNECFESGIRLSYDIVKPV